MDKVKINLPVGLELERQSTNMPDTPVSPSGNRRVRTRIWRSACIELDKDFVVFISSYLVLTGLLTFFCIGLYNAESCEESILLLFFYSLYFVF